MVAGLQRIARMGRAHDFCGSLMRPVWAVHGYPRSERCRFQRQKSHWTGNDTPVFSAWQSAGRVSWVMLGTHTHTHTHTRSQHFRRGAEPVGRRLRRSDLASPLTWRNVLSSRPACTPERRRKAKQAGGSAFASCHQMAAGAISLARGADHWYLMDNCSLTHWHCQSLLRFRISQSPMLKIWMP